MALLALVAGACWLGLRKTRQAVACGVLTFCLFIWWHETTYVRGRGEAQEEGVRILFWNVADGDMGWPGIASTIRAMDGDVVGLMEAVHGADARREFWRREFPDYSVFGPRNDMALLCRGQFLETSSIRLTDDVDAGVFKLRVADLRLRVILLDITSSLFVRRKGPLSALGDLLECQPVERLVVIGDFNTPPDSTLLRDAGTVGFALRNHLVNAFEEAGRGCHATWPVPVPLIATDQVWLSPDLDPGRCGLVSTRLSDHRAVVVDVAAGGGTQTDER